MPMSEANKSTRALARLIRFALSGPFHVGTQEGATLPLRSVSGAGRGVDPGLLREAVARGLIVRDGAVCRAAPEARAFLRRRLADPDEPFQEQHRETARVSLPAAGGEPRRTVRRNLDDTPLATLSRLKDRDGTFYFAPALIDAGERLAADFHHGGLQPGITARWQPRLDTRASGASGGMADLADSALAARMRVARAVEAMGPELAGVALDVCCFMKGLETVERERLWPARSAKLMLRTALSTLARHYDPPRPAAPRTRHWGADGFRPTL